MQVKRTVWKGKVSPPKTSRSHRSKKLSKMALSVLNLYEEKRNSCEWVFPNQAGKPMDRCGFSSRRWKPLLRRAGLPHSIRFHDLRHTCATLLLSEGVNVKVVSEMLGHASITITLNTYSHVLPDMQDSAAEAMEAALGTMS